MKTNAIATRQDWRLLAATLGVLAMAGAGCNCISINIGGAPTPVQVRAPAGVATGPPAGGNFVPVQAALAANGSATVCGQPVSGKYVRFYPPTQTPPAGYAGFQGRLEDAVTGAIIPNNHYYLQWFVTAANQACCTPVPGGLEVSCPVTPGLTYRFIAHFKVGVAPPPTVRLVGAWTDSEVNE